MTSYEDAAQEVAARKLHWVNLRARQGAIRALVESQWATVFPDDSSDVQMPMISNVFRTTIEDGGRLFAEGIPTERTMARRPRETSRNEDREKALVAYNQNSRIYDVREWLGQDMIAAGYTAIKVWPDFGKPAEQRFPVFRRLDPLNVLPEPRWVPDRPTESVIVNYTEPMHRLKVQFPEKIQELLDKIAEKKMQVLRDRKYAMKPGETITNEPPELEIADYYATDYICRLAFYSDPDSGENITIPLLERDNDTGLCPIQIAYRPTWASEPIGQLDDTKGVHLTRNRYMRLILDYFVDMVYGGKLVWNVRNPGQKGPGVTHYALGPDAFEKPITPENPGYQALQVLGMLEDEGRSGGVSPKSREGDVDLNKATAAFLSKAQGQLSSVTRSLQRNFAAAKRNANEVAFAQDEKWCDARKEIIGVARGRRFSTTYTPSETIKGDYQNTVEYGPMSGLDVPTHQVLTNQKLQLGSISVETAMEQDPTLEDVPAELARMATHQMRTSILGGLLLPEVPLPVRAQAWKILREADDVDMALDQIVAIAAAPQPLAPAAAPAPGGAALGGPSGTAGAESPAAPVPIDLLRKVATRR